MRIVVDGVNMCLVVVWVGICDIVEGLFCKLFFGYDLIGMFGIDV